MMKVYAKWKFPTLTAAKKAIKELEYSIFSWGWQNEKTDDGDQFDGFDLEDGTITMTKAKRGNSRYGYKKGDVIVTWRMTCKDKIDDLDEKEGDELWGSPAPLGKNEVESFLFHIQQV